MVNAPSLFRYTGELEKLRRPFNESKLGDHIARLIDCLLGLLRLGHSIQRRQRRKIMHYNESLRPSCVILCNRVQECLYRLASSI